MKIGEFLSKCNKEEIPFILYKGNGEGYKIPCVDCDFYKQTKQGMYNCTSIFYDKCKQEFIDWITDEEVGYK